MIIAHTQNAAGKRQDLLEHLRNVADAAAQYGSPFGAATLASSAGLLHDIGKFNPAFQQYLLEAERNPLNKPKSVDHKGAGTLLATTFDPNGFLSFMIAGHHGGLPSMADLKTTIRDKAFEKAIDEAIALAQGSLPELQALSQDLIPAQIAPDIEREFFTRIAFSALVDADFLDTEQHFYAGKTMLRNNMLPIADVLLKFQTWYHQKFAEVGQSILNDLRAEVFQYCLEAAEQKPGIFRLTVPTGGGKTLASLGFALNHADRYGFERIIYAIPYTSITEQTTNVFREIFLDGLFLLEHHSSVTWKDPDSPTTAEIRNRLASENWDATLIVTTTVQLFESLLGNTPSACRKLHNIARSVIILDEVQMLPTTLLTTILNVLRQLVEHYGVTVVLCTATQPDFDPRPGFRGLPTIREIVPQPERFFKRLKRVEYQLPGSSEIWTWEQVARRVQTEEQVLVIVNTRADAVKVLDALKPTDPLDIIGDNVAINPKVDRGLKHLSTRLCGAHRRVVLEEVCRRLKAREPCRLIATQVVEAGVDIDFPLVLRALGPLDRMVQAAGRANREGTRPQGGTAIVFIPQDGGVPPGPYKTGTDITRILLKRGYTDLHDPALYQEYFRMYYSEVDLDNKQIEGSRSRYDYPEVTRKFRMIEDDQSPVVVRYPNRPATEETVGTWLNELRTKPNRALLRALQPYIVNLRPLELKKAQQQGLVEEVVPGLWEWYGHYDEVYGIVMDGVQNAEHNVW